MQILGESCAHAPKVARSHRMHDSLNLLLSEGKGYAWTVVKPSHEHIYSYTPRHMHLFSHKHTASIKDWSHEIIIGLKKSVLGSLTEIIIPYLGHTSKEPVQCHGTTKALQYF